MCLADRYKTIYICASGSVGGARPCQGRGRGFESRLALFKSYNTISYMREWLSWWSTTLPRSGPRVRVPSRALSIEYLVFWLQSTTHMREWLSWWSTTLPRSGPRVRVPSRAFFISHFPCFLILFFHLILCYNTP